MNRNGVETRKIQKLISEFVCLTEEEKRVFLIRCIGECKLPLIQILYEETERILARDFVKILPSELTEKIFSYLDPISLCRASCVSNKWRTAANTDSLWFHICEQKQWISLSENKTLEKKPEVLIRPTSAVAKTLNSLHKQYDFSLENSKVLPLARACKWKDHYVRVSHIERNWKHGLYIVKPVLRGHTQPVTCMDCNGMTIVSGSSDATVRLWNALTCECEATLKQFTGPVKCLQIKGTMLITGCADAIIRIFDMEKYRILRELHGHQGGIDHISCGDRVLASSSSTDRMIKLWSLKNGSCLFDLTGHSDDIEILKLKKNTLVSASWDESVRVWDVLTGTCLLTLRGHTEVVMCCQMDDEKLMTGGADGNIIIWDLHQGHLKQTLYGHAEVYCLQFNEKIIASGYADSAVVIWSIHGDLRHVLDGHIGIVRCIRLQGTRLVSGGDCKRVIVWDSESGELVNVVHRHPTSLHLMWVDETRIVTASPETPGTVTVLSYWA